MIFKYCKKKKSCTLHLVVALVCTTISRVEWGFAFTSKTIVRRFTIPPIYGIQEKSQDRLPESLIEALDLAPLLERVSNHAGTKRGREAILDLVNYRQTPTSFPKANNLSRRERLMLSASSRSSLNNGGSRPTSNELLSVATSSTEARKEYELVEEALLALSDNAYNLTYPPIYAVGSSPIDGETVIHTDDDEWLYMAPDSWTLENLVQAEQVIRRLINAKKWADLDETQTWMPGLSAIGLQIDHDNELPTLYSEIDGVVDIVRVRTLDDPAGKSSYTFQIKCEKFPILKLLRDKESMLLDMGRKPRDREMISILEEIEEVESQIQMGLAQSIGKCETLRKGLDSITRLDTIFARAGFGYTLNGQIPIILNEGTISVEEFIHPVLATNDGFSLNADGGKIGMVVPVDLELCSDTGKRALIISGPNGGGKTLSMKSFGLVSAMAKLGLPIPVSIPSNGRPRVDYFNHVLVDVGDQQNVLGGTSTWTSKLNSWASIIARLGDENMVSQSSEDQSSDSLILLDELGSGTDPEAGGAVAQAILEELMAFSSCHIVATTHSPRLKSLSYESSKFNCAAVLLDRSSDIPGISRRPSFRLSYGTIGESHAMIAASRCSPSLPESVLSRASELMAEKSSSDDDIGSKGAYIQALSSSMEEQVIRAESERVAAEQDATASARCRKAMLSLAASYEGHLTRLEQRLADSYTKLKQQTDDDLKIVGDTLAEVRVVKNQVKSQEELLRDKGLKVLPSSYLLQPGESVVILATGEWEGTTVKVIATSESDDRLRPTEVLVKPSSSFLSWDEMFDENADIGIDMMMDRPIIVQRHELAIWDYDSVWDYGDVVEAGDAKATSVSDSKRRLNSVLSNLKTEAPTKTSDSSRPPSSFTSSRQRKAAKGKKRKKNK